METLDSLHAGELEGTDALQEQVDRWRELEATVPLRSITVPDDCAASPIIALATSPMTSLMFLRDFGRFPKTSQYCGSCMRIKLTSGWPNSANYSRSPVGHEPIDNNLSTSCLTTLTIGPHRSDGKLTARFLIID